MIYKFELYIHHCVLSKQAYQHPTYWRGVKNNKFGFLGLLSTTADANAFLIYVATATSSSTQTHRSISSSHQTISSFSLSLVQHLVSPNIYAAGPSTNRFTTLSQLSFRLPNEILGFSSVHLDIPNAMSPTTRQLKNHLFLLLSPLYIPSLLFVSKTTNENCASAAHRRSSR